MHNTRHIHISLIALILLVLQGCATPHVQPPGSGQMLPILYEDAAIMDDGYRLPLSRWEPDGTPRAIVLALHGLNDYRNSFDTTGSYLAQHGFALVAPDLRGHGETDGAGLWHGSDRMAHDFRDLVNLLSDAYPYVPLYVIGESMGGAVVLAALDQDLQAVDGIALIAPAIWSRDTMPFYQRWALWLAAHTMPAKELTGEGLDLHPSDNIEMLRALGRDPLVIKATRVDVLYGVSNLMDQAASVPVFNGRMLILYGAKDDIIPLEPTCQWLDSLPPDNGKRRQVLIYENGYHMLTRDLQAEVVLKDIAEWIGDGAVLEHRGLVDVERFCY